MRHFVLIQGNINYQVKLLKDFKLFSLPGCTYSNDRNDHKYNVEPAIIPIFPDVVAVLFKTESFLYHFLTE
jgi:hypothetical protein